MSLPLPEYDGLDGLAIADLVRRRALSAAEVTEAALARMAARNPRLNAVVRPLDAMARWVATSAAVSASTPVNWCSTPRGTGTASSRVVMPSTSCVVITAPKANTARRTPWGSGAPRARHAMVRTNAVTESANSRW
jgi:hypothetical protein